MKPLLLITLMLVSLPLMAEKLSGYHFVKEETRIMQDDDFENPGMMAVEQGMELFQEVHESSGKSCASCHGDEGEKLKPASIATWPHYDSKNDDVITLQEQINSCRSRVTDDKLATDSLPLIRLETFVRYLAKGEKVNVETRGPVAARVARGEELFNTRYGLIDLSCYHCHSLYPGFMIRGQKMSQGQTNGFPAYRLDSGEMANVSLRIQQCLNLMRSEPFATGSEEIESLSLYLMSRSNGLAIETPAVRY